MGFENGNKADGKHYWLTPPELMAQTHSIPRQIAMYRIRRGTSLSLCDIGSIFKKAGQKTVVYGIDRIDSLLKFNRGFREKYGRIVG